MSKTGYSFRGESSKGQINKLSWSEQKVTSSLKLERQGILGDLSATEKSAGITEDGMPHLGQHIELG